MNTYWILVYWVMSSGTVALDKIEFPTLVGCNLAKDQLQAHGAITAECLEIK